MVSDDNSLETAVVSDDNSLETAMVSGDNSLETSMVSGDNMANYKVHLWRKMERQDIYLFMC